VEAGAATLTELRERYAALREGQEEENQNTEA
jgi:hypothetical protein